MKFYIAFSIHGTNAFIVATQELLLEKFHYERLPLTAGDTVVIASKAFQVARSRHPDAARLGVKLHWDKLSVQVKSETRPTVSPNHVLWRFSQLEKDGWALVPESRVAFTRRHYPTALS